MKDIDRRSFLKTASVAGIAGVAGCLEGITGGGGGSGELNKLGFSSYVRGGSWITAYVDAARYYAQDHNIELDVRPNRQSVQNQIEDIRDFTRRGYDGIIVGVWQTGAVGDAIQNALDEGIAVMATNADTANPNIPLYVGFSNYSGGQKCAKQMVKALQELKPNEKPWKVVNVRGTIGNQSADQRSQGFLDEMKKQPDVEVADTIAAEYSRTTALEKTQQWITANGKPNGIYSGNLSMGLGVYTALKNLGMMYKRGNDKHVVLTQMDGGPQVNQLIDQTYIDAAVDQPNYFYNPLAMKYMGNYIEAGGVDGGGEEAIPDVGGTVTKDEFSIEANKHTINGDTVKLWRKQIWSPADIREQNGHPWFETDSIVITRENAKEDYLWGNIWG